MKKSFKRVEFMGIIPNRSGSQDLLLLILKETGADFCVAVPVSIYAVLPVLIKDPKMVIIGQQLKPMVHDLVADVIRESNISITKLIISSDIRGACDANLIREKGTANQAIEISLIDGVAVAIRLGIPIYCEECLIKTPLLNDFHTVRCDVDGLGEITFKINVENDDGTKEP